MPTESPEIKWSLSSVHDLSHSEIKQLESLLSEFSDLTSTGEDDLGKTKLVYHEIDTGDAQPIWQSARRLPLHKKKEVRQLLDNMVSRGIVEPSQGP